MINNLTQDQLVGSAKLVLSVITDGGTAVVLASDEAVAATMAEQLSQ